MRQIPLNHGLVTFVDDEDYERFAGLKWTADHQKQTWYAIHKVPRCDGVWTTVHLHRLILDAPLGIQIDHRDGDGLHNTRTNLRLCSNVQNSWNQRVTPGGTSRFKGVSWRQDAGKWRVTIKKYGRQHHLGYFLDEAAAALAYNKAALDLFGEFARLNAISGVR